MADSSDDEVPLLDASIGAGTSSNPRTRALPLRPDARQHVPAFQSSNQTNANGSGNKLTKRAVEDSGLTRQGKKQRSLNSHGQQGSSASNAHATKRTKHNTMNTTNAGSKRVRADNSRHASHGKELEEEGEEFDDDEFLENLDEHMEDNENDALFPRNNESGEIDGDETKRKRNQIVIRDLLPTSYVGLSSTSQTCAASTIKLFLQPSAIFNRKHACSKDFVDWRGVTRGIVPSKFVHTGSQV